MFSFMKLNTSPSTKPPVPMRKGLPTGFDDPESVFFVPEELRASYLAVSANAAGRSPDTQHLVHNAAVSTAENELLDEYPNMSVRAWNSAVLNLAEQLETNSYFEMLDYGIHLENTDKAKTLQKHKDRGEADRLATREKHTCPVCNQYDLASNGQVATRPLAFVNRFGTAALPNFKSCQSCFEVAMAECLTRASNAQVIASDGWTQTRAEAVQEQLSILLKI